MNIPEKYQGNYAICIYQMDTGEYTLQIICDFEKNIEQYLSGIDGHKKIGDRHVCDVLDVNIKSMEKISPFIKNLDPKTKITAKDFFSNLEKILGE